MRFLFSLGLNIHWCCYKWREKDLGLIFFPLAHSQVKDYVAVVALTALHTFLGGFVVYKTILNVNSFWSADLLHACNNGSMEKGIIPVKPHNNHNNTLFTTTI